MQWIKTDGKIVLSGIVMMLVMGSVYSYSVFRLPIEDYYNISSAQSGVPYMLSLFFYALFMGVSGKLLENTSHFKVMISGALFITLGWLLAFIGKNFVVLALGYGVFIGTGIGLIYGIPLMVITERYEKKKGLYLGLVLLGFGLSPFLTAPFMQWLLDSTGLHQTFLFMSLFTFAILMSLSLFYRHTKKSTNQKRPTPFIGILKTGKYQLLYSLFFHRDVHRA
jgi:MFS family permease